jgi:hypothetical protein
MFVNQLCMKVRIRHMKDGLMVRIYNVRKCGLCRSWISESPGLPVHLFSSFQIIDITIYYLTLTMGTRIVQADSGTDSDSENWCQSAQRMSFVYQCRCVEWWQAPGGSARQSESGGLPEWFPHSCFRQSESVGHRHAKWPYRLIRICWLNLHIYCNNNGYWYSKQ